MQIIPAIDLMDGKVVRLVRGDPGTVKAYEHFGDPVTVAKKWESEGADAIHVVDLDATLERGNNFEIIEKIARVVDLPIQVGGGIKSLETAQKLLSMGIDRIVLGALAFKEPSTLVKLLKKYGNERIVVALDYCNDEVMIRGWKATTKLSVDEALTKFQSLKVKIFLVTSIARDGTLRGPDYETLARLCKRSGISVIASGGVSSLNDLANLKRVGAWGVVIGKALYEGLFNLNDALKIAKEKVGVRI